MTPHDGETRGVALHREHLIKGRGRWRKKGDSEIREERRIVGNGWERRGWIKKEVGDRK